MEAPPWNSLAPFQILSTAQTAGSSSNHSESLPDRGAKESFGRSRKPQRKKAGCSYGILGMLVACNTARNIDSHDTPLTSRNNPAWNQVPMFTTSSAEQRRGHRTQEKKCPCPRFCVSTEPRTLIHCGFHCDNCISKPRVAGKTTFVIVLLAQGKTNTHLDHNR